MKIFNKNLETKIDWILNALLYAEKNEIKLLNLPFGRENLENKILSDKIQSMTSSGYVFIVAMGNEGNKLGSINYPASLLSVISVGSFDFNLNMVQDYSS